MAESKRISETESEDFANEEAEKRFQHTMLNGDNFEAVSLSSVVSGLFDEDDLEVDSLDLPDDEIPSLDLCDDEYNELENYGS